jgi:hypothetical protein
MNKLDALVSYVHNGTQTKSFSKSIQVKDIDGPASLLETSLGDIMKSSYAQGSAPPSSTNSLATQYNVTRPMDRILLTANGNVQRLVSSYYDAPVRVVVKRFCKTTQHGTTATNDTSVPNVANTTFLERLVELQVYNRTFCVAWSILQVLDENCLRLIESGHVGLGQLFQFYNVLPEFTLLNAGTGPMSLNGCIADQMNHSESVSDTSLDGLWRSYRLDCQYISCQIQEHFCENVWDLRNASRC